MDPTALFVNMDSTVELTTNYESLFNVKKENMAEAKRMGAAALPPALLHGCTCLVLALEEYCQYNQIKGEELFRKELKKEGLNKVLKV